MLDYPTNTKMEHHKGASLPGAHGPPWSTLLLQLKIVCRMKVAVRGAHPPLDGVAVAAGQEPSSFDSSTPERPYLKRSFDSRSDPRVPFIRMHGNGRCSIPSTKTRSLFVVAPTSAGKTFVSFCAMKKVLQAATARSDLRCSNQSSRQPDCFRDPGPFLKVVSGTTDDLSGRSTQETIRSIPRKGVQIFVTSCRIYCRSCSWLRPTRGALLRGRGGEAHHLR